MISIRRVPVVLLFAAALCLQGVWAQLPEKFTVHPDGAGTEKQPWSPAVLAGNTLYLSAQNGRRPDGSWPESFQDEARQCFENMRLVLEAAGMDLSNVVSSYVYMTDLNDYEPMNQVFREVFPSLPPVRSTMGVGRLRDRARIEVQAIAVQHGFPRIYYPVPNGWEDFTSWWPYSGAIKVNGIIYLAGLGTANMHTGKQPETLKLQIRQSMVSLGELLERAGADYRHVVFVNPYLTPPGDWAPLNVVYRQFFEFGNTPARATLTMADIPGVNPVEITAVAVEDLEKREVARPVSRELSPTASPAVFAGDVLYFSGFSGFMPGYGMVAKDFEGQVRAAMRNVQDCLEAAGMTLDNIVSVSAYLGDIQDYDRMMAVYREYFPHHPPALTVIQQSPTSPDNRPAVQFSPIAVRSVTAR